MADACVHLRLSVVVHVIRRVLQGKASVGCMGTQSNDVGTHAINMGTHAKDLRMLVSTLFVAFVWVNIMD